MESSGDLDLEYCKGDLFCIGCETQFLHCLFNTCDKCGRQIVPLDYSFDECKIKDYS